jgi:microsomal dipeptidase-like Zn-dependent dipeptidase
MARNALRVILAVLFLLAVLAPIAGPALLESRMNGTLPGSAGKVSARAAALHRSLVIADLHADSLLWGRNLLRRSSRGHVDVPRLLDGNVALQAFTIVTKSPRGLNIESNADSTDDITPLFVLLGRPPRTWNSLTERALDQAARLHGFAARSAGQLSVIHTRRELDAYLERRRSDPRITAGFLGIEGAHALDGRLENLERLRAAGIHLIGLAHFFDNEFSGSAHGVKKGGLTEAGRELVRRVESGGMAIDLAHASPAAFAEAAAMSRRPLIVSHTGVRGTCDNRRNLSDEQLRTVARSGGVIGIGYWDTAVCGTDVAAIVRAIRYAANIVGAQHVALGSDFDGAISAPFDTSHLDRLTEGLLAAGFSEDDVRKVMGENMVRVLRATLPE